MPAEQVAIAMEQTQQRSEISSQYCWNVEALYPSWNAWEGEFGSWAREKQSVRWPELEKYKNSWSSSSEELAKLIETYCGVDRVLSKLYTYAHLRHDEDVAGEQAKNGYSRIRNTLYAFAQETSWIEPALLSLSEKQWEALMSSSRLDPYRFYLERMVRMRSHTLPAEQEALLAMAGPSMEAAAQGFNALNNADLKFSPAIDSQGKERELTHGKYGLYLRDQDRALRESAFKNLHKAFLSHENLLCELLGGQVQRHLFSARARKFSSCLQAALFPQQIDEKVYTALIQAVRSHLPALHRYVKLRKEVMGLDQLHLYDLHVPLVKAVQMQMPYDKAANLIVESVAILGKDYQEKLASGLLQERWVDRYENLRKRSGAYSSGCYDSMPYILMNYHGSFNDVMTLSHEAGHSMHSWHSRKYQPYHYSDYSIFVAEVASTFHEELLLQHLLKQATSKEEKAFLINQKLDDMRSTLLRQTMFAEFELKIHQLAEQGTPLTPSLLKTIYRKLNQEYFGAEVVIDEEADIEWARIPHFYANFYVYQYATGISAAHALVERVTEGGLSAREDYIKFLSAGSSVYPIDALKLAGVNMLTPDPIESAMRHFDALVTELETLLKDCR